MNKLKACFNNSPYGSTKHTNYFDIYEKLLSKYRNKRCTLIEVGVLNGGSLHMWRKYLGDKAKIIGIDLNPEAKKWVKDGFEIYIGDQSSDDFWTSTLAKIKNFDIFIDDGGHTNYQQKQTLDSLLRHNNKKDSLLIFEDTHASFMREFGNPSFLSFLNLSKRDINQIYKPSNKKIFSISYYNSIIVYELKNKIEKSEICFNKKFKFLDNDFRHQQLIGYRFIKSLIKNERLKIIIKFWYYKLINLKILYKLIKYKKS